MLEISAPQSAEVFSSPRESDRSPVVIDNQMKINTPENISFHYYLAGPFQRAIAYLLDVMLVMVSWWVTTVLLYMGLYALLIAGPPEFWDAVQGIFWMVALIGNFLVFWFYGAYMETYYNGRTLGKMICSQRVLNDDGRAIDGMQATVRNFFRLIDTFPMFGVGMLWGVVEEDSFFLPTGMFGLLMMSLNSQFRRVGDFVAGTIVVFEQRKQAGGIVRFNDPRVASLAELLPHGFVVDRNLAMALAAFVERRTFLGPDRTNEIACRLTPVLIPKLGVPHDTNPDLLLCALYYKSYLSTQELVSEQERHRQSRHEVPASIPGLPESGTPQALQESLRFDEIWQRERQP